MLLKLFIILVFRIHVTSLQYNGFANYLKNVVSFMKYENFQANKLFV